MKLTLQQKIDRRNKVNKNAKLRIGAPVVTLDRLMFLSSEKRSVFCDNCWGLLPACVLIGMPARLIHSVLISGRLFEYIPRTTK